MTLDEFVRDCSVGQRFSTDYSLKQFKYITQVKLHFHLFSVLYFDSVTFVSRLFLKKILLNVNYFGVIG